MSDGDGGERPVLSVEAPSPGSKLAGCFAVATVVACAVFYFFDLPPWLPLAVAVLAGLIVFGWMLSYRQLLLTAKRAGLKRADLPAAGQPASFPWLTGRLGPPDGGFVLHGERDGFRVSLFVERRREGGKDGGSTSSVRGVVWELPSLALPSLHAHGPERHWHEVLAEGFWQTLTGEPTPVAMVPDARGRLPLRPSSPVEGFAERVEVRGGPGAEALLTEGVQTALLARPRPGHLECEGPLVRWEEDGGISGRTAADIERLVSETAPLRDALLSSGTFLFLAPEEAPGRG